MYLEYVHAATLDIGKSFSAFSFEGSRGYDRKGELLPPSAVAKLERVKAPVFIDRNLESPP